MYDPIVQKQCRIISQSRTLLTYVDGFVMRNRVSREEHRTTMRAVCVPDKPQRNKTQYYNTAANVPPAWFVYAFLKCLGR